jgi:hypothetical protein
MSVKPTGASRATPSVPRKSRSPSAAAQRDADRRRDCFQRHACACDQRLQQHVARAQLRSASPCRRMESSYAQRPPRFDLAGDRRRIESSAGTQGHDRSLRFGPIAVLEGRLKRAQLIDVRPYISYPLHPQSCHASRSVRQPRFDHSCRRLCDALTRHHDPQWLLFWFFRPDDERPSRCHRARCSGL